MKSLIWLNYSRYFRSFKGPVLVIFTQVSILFSSIEVLPKFIASWVILVLFSKFNGVIFKVRKVQFGPLLSILVNISETLHAMTNVCMKHIHKSLWSFSLSLDLERLLKVKSRSQNFQGACLINGASYNQSLREIHVVSHIWPFSFLTFDVWWNWKVQIKVTSFQRQIFHKPSMI